jgi:UDPglucose 6-dehydrogenase
VDTSILEAVDLVNTNRVEKFLANLSATVGEISGLRLAVWGLSFKPGTDDVAEAPSLRLVSKLLDAGAFVCIYDPEAIPTFMSSFNTLSDNLYPCLTGIDAALGADALLILTDWQEFIDCDIDLLKASMKSPVILDGRNCLDALKLMDQGFIYRGLGV